MLKAAAAMASDPTPVRETVYQLSGVGKTYARNAVHALQDINLTLAKGSFSSVIGSSGCGKSTLLKIMAVSFRHRKAGSSCRGGPSPARAGISA